MLNSQLPYIDIKKIKLAHEFTLNKENRCSYPNGRNYYGIIYCVEGEAEYKFSSKKTCTLRDGDIILLSPKAAYSITTKNYFKHYTINFETHEKSTNIDFLKDNFYLLHTENPQWYSHTFKKLLARWTSGKINSQLTATASLYEIFAIFISEIFEKEYSSDSYLRLEPAKTYLEQHYDSEITLDILANCVNMSVTHFRREWLKLYGESALEYRNKIRISYAEKYLMSGYYSISEISRKCGFNDVNYFIRFFKKYMGISPGKYQKTL